MTSHVIRQQEKYSIVSTITGHTPRDTLASTTAREAQPSIGGCQTRRAPRRHMTLERSRAKYNLQRRWATSTEYASFPRSDWSCATRLTSAAAPLPHPPVEESTKGEKWIAPLLGLSDHINAVSPARSAGSRQRERRCGSKTYKG